MNVLYAISWTEYERGWGCRPDGCTFHRSSEEAELYLQNYQAKQPKDHVPDDYTVADGKPHIVEVSESLESFVKQYGDVWLMRSNSKNYKDYDATSLFERKKQ